MSSEHRELSLDALWSMLQNQQREIEQLKSPGHRESRTEKLSNGHLGSVSRAGMLKAAALGVAGVAGAGAFLEGTGVAQASLGEGQSSFSSTASPTVLISNTGTGQALSASANTSTAAAVSNASTAANTSALQGFMTSTNAAIGSAGVKGLNNCSNTAAPGYGVYGNCPSGYGVVGLSTSLAGVYGGSSNYIGFWGTSSSTAINMSGVYGLLKSTSPGDGSAGVRGASLATGSVGIGVWGSHAGSGWGVYGTANGIGVYGVSTAGSGVAGASTTGAGVYGSSTSGVGVQGLSFSTAANASAVQGLMNSAGSGANSSGVFGQNNGTGNMSIGVWGSTMATSGNWAVYGTGNIGASGTKSAVVKFADGVHRKFYCMESPECWFEDFGAATMRNGHAEVKLDPQFAQSVVTKDYHVFLTPRGDSKGLYISRQGSSGFVVREQEGGRSTLEFSYRIVAIRKDVNAPRLEITTVPHVPGAPKPMKAPKPAKHMQKTDPGAVIDAPAFLQEAQRDM